MIYTEIIFFIVLAVALLFAIRNIRKRQEVVMDRNLKQIDESLAVARKSQEYSKKSVELLNEILAELKQKS